eukprot:974291-Amphidinium_carterae.1
MAFPFLSSECCCSLLFLLERSVQSFPWPQVHQAASPHKERDHSGRIIRLDVFGKSIQMPVFSTEALTAA